MESFDEEEEEQTTIGPGWLELQRSVGKLRDNFTLLCDSLESIVNLENTKLVATGRVEIPDTSRRILWKEQQFIKKFREKLQNYTPVELEGGDNSPEYAVLYNALIKELHSSILAMNKDLIKKLNKKTQAAKSVIQENKKLILEQQEREKQLLMERKRAETANGEKNTIDARCKKLEEQMDQKNKKIKQLQTESTVVLWNREKQRLIGNIHSREKGLEQELWSSTSNADETRFRLEKRIEDLQDKLSLMKVRSSKNGISKQDAEKLQRNLFLKERLFVVAESELRKQQIYYLGLLKGLQKDYHVLKAVQKKSEEKQNNDNNNNDDDTTKENDQREEQKRQEFDIRMEKVIEALSKGEITKLRSSLPSHYLGVSVVLQGGPGKGAQERKAEFIVKVSEDIVKDIDNSDLGASLVKWRLGDEELPSLGKLLRDIQREHPSFVDAEGRLQVKEVRAYFPTLTEDRIINYFNVFQTWDDNGDLTLDTSEILHNLPGILGYMSTTEEVADAIREIDIDESGTIDFYEFLLLMKMLESGEGKSKFFQKNDFLKVTSRMDRTTTPVSKTCCIQ